MNFIEIKDVVKRYSGHTALDGVTISVPKGCIYGLLGPNGAGKTSLIRIINRITRQDSGEVLLDGRPIVDDDVTRIGYLPEERGLYKKMKVLDQIVYLARLKGMPKSIAVAEARSWLKRFDLEQWADKKLEALSKGMQQKVQFIATVIHRPQLLIFDEPFSGFDPVNAEQLKQEILALRDGGATILFSTHNMESVEAVCEQITLINQSRVVLQGSVDEIRHAYKKNIIAVSLEGGQALPANDDLYAILPAKSDNKRETLIKLNSGVGVRSAVSWLNDNCNLTGFHEVLPSMHEIFIETVNLTKQQPQ
ncbi:MAG: ATP-binding cassette domain-containing protein [Bacteroidales bacterium]|nr:ATP-binding cassette domain-containing protein [Candidatus Sodaliphilus limicaballi]